ncbi:uncharacterized protein LOC115789875 isoform X5 [Archocentrus centrarchus]|uniref:uncharacterized protein LOC115789875 isoform X5 n=1 Tax=Archocentrus centrarchus TaxID=63155 RepID=UPI0011E9C0D8|nr:uncharacterized protein LOC115789875 isoform X5 [Archocentrus centrarchus]
MQTGSYPLPLYSSIWLTTMRWQCKTCGFRATTRGDLLTHYRLQHRTFETGNSISAEFQRITTVQLEPKFMSGLDLHTPKLLKLFHAKGGALGQRLKIIMEPLENSTCPTVETAREVVLRCLIEYLGEHGEHLIKEFSDTENLEELGQLVVAITVITKDIASTSDSPKEIGVVIEGMEVIRGLGDIARACCLLLGLTYALNLDYPKQLKYTFEVFQKLFLELDASKLSKKVQSLKSKLLA